MGTWGNSPGAVATLASLAGATINAAGHLILTKADGSSLDVGLIVGPKGDSGVAGSQGIPGLSGVAGVKGDTGPAGDPGIRTASLTVPALAALATTNLAVTWTSPFPDTNYRVVTSIMGSSLVSIQQVVGKTTTGCTIAVKNLSASALLIGTASVDFVAVKDI